MIGFAARSRRPSSGLGIAVPGPYTVTTEVGPISRAQCPSKIYEDQELKAAGQDLCCIEVGGGNWRCRPVQGAAVPPAGTPAGTYDTCLRTLQTYLVNQGQAVPTTGLWNPETERLLAFRFPNPRGYPGGPCAMLAMLELHPEQPLTAGTFSFPSLPTGISGTTLAVAAIAAVGLILLLSRRASAAAPAVVMAPAPVASQAQAA